MWLSTVLIRVLLSVALILNGATQAMVSVQMTHGAASIASMPEKKASSEMPCHQHEQAAASLTADPSAAPDSPPKTKHPAPDCCKFGACRCACLHSAPAAVPMMIYTPALVDHSQSVLPIALGHVAPALPHLIRPPIG